MVTHRNTVACIRMHKKQKKSDIRYCSLLPLFLINFISLFVSCRGLINDFFYAEAFSRSRWSSFCWGPRRIKQALLQKGVNETDAEKAMKLVFEQDDSGSSQELNLGMSKSLLESLFTKASKQWLQGRDVPHETRKSRIIRWLQYRGFNWAVTSYIVKRLESKHPPQVY
uniref:Regulatory protein RecX n=1 Tax=Nelumbo nucifera TaxID=4432 RepID=A0A822XU27_NELNU|nr:TPA_asm: hypothetical protein HUJ06_025290 [Nelumbo nucifera]